ncbi:MAG: NADPH:quinone oxidoreductase family protein [Solirubrobacterales bacterium]|nr:NADPH:quinone oxidoreductase family protein [Solirubrobacterales bacterium]
MRALRVTDDTAGPGGVRLADVPEPGEDALVVRVRAAGVGFPDLLMSHGRFQIRQPVPFTLGWEAAGEVVHAPAGSAFAPGDRVVTLSFGAHAEQVAAVPEATFALPAGLSDEQAAALPLNYLTAYAALRRRGRLQAGETVLVHGAAGGTGTAAVQVAKALGARVLAVVSTPEKAETARAAGADEAFPASGDWRAQVLEAGGADVAFDPVGGDRFADTLRCMNAEGRVVVVGFADGAIPTVAVNRLLLRNVDVCGCTWSVLATTPTGLADAAAELSRMVVAGAVTPLVGATYALEDGPRALRDLEQRRARGKAVLVA